MIHKFLFLPCWTFLFLCCCFTHVNITRAEVHTQYPSSISHPNYSIHGKANIQRKKDCQNSLSNHGYPKENCHVESNEASLLSSSDSSFLLRGGFGGRKNHKNDEAVMVVPPSTTMETWNEKVESIKVTARKMKRTEFWTLIALRIGFVLLFPLAVIGFGLTLVVSLILIAVRILTLNFFFRDVSKISLSVMRITISLIMACLTGVISPLFALFGLLASLSVAIFEMAEPILRIRYARQMKKLAHLHKLITDPVLMETMGVVIRGASVLSSAAVEAGQTIQESTSKTVKKGFLTVKGTATDASKDLVETLLQSSGAVQAQKVFETKLPSPVVSWGKDQWESLRRSGALEAAATRALQALRKDLGGATAFLPYLEAIDEVRKKQQQAQPHK